MKRFAILSMIFVVGIMSLVMTACGKEKSVNFTFENENVAEFVFDSDDYHVGDTAVFSVTIDEKYSQSNFTVYANDELVIKSYDGKYHYDLNSENVSFEIKDYALNQYSYTLTESQGFELSTLSVGSIPHGDSFSFYISTDRYSSGYVVKVNGAIITPNGNGEYTVDSVTSNLSIKVENAILKTFEITFDVPTGVDIDGYTITPKPVVNYGDSITFDVELLEGYEKDDFVVKVNNQEISYNNGYTVSNITSNTIIVISGVKLKTYNISFENTTGITGVSNTTVTHGSSYTITYDIADNYHVTSDFNIMINGQPFLRAGDPIVYTFTLSEVSRDMVVSFGGLELDSYYVYHDIPTGVNISGSDTVSHGEDYTFTYSLQEGYEESDSFDILVNGTSIYESGVSTYTIEDVVENIDIEIVGVDIKILTITFENTLGLLILGNDGEYLTGNTDTVYYDGTYSFGCDLLFDEGYRIYPDFNVYCNGESIYNGTYSYTLSYVKQNLTIRFVGVGLARHSIDYTLNIPNSCDVVLSNNEVEHGKGYTITITAKEGYDISNLEYEIESNVTATSSIVKTGDSYVINVSNVRDSQRVVISGIEEIVTNNSFNILSLPEGMIVELILNEWDDGGTYIEDISSVEITPEDVLTVLAIVDEESGYVMNTNMFELITNTGVVEKDQYDDTLFTITNITADLTIDVMGVYNPDSDYILVYEEGDDYTFVYKDNKYVFAVDEYVTFDIDVVGDAESVSVTVNGDTIAYVQDVGYTFQVKSSMDNEIIISVIIIR